MKRRTLIVITIALALSILSGPASALTQSMSTYWGCVGNHTIDVGVCIKDPLPNPPSLPRPELPAIPQ